MLTKIGGENEGQCIRSALRHIISYDLGAVYSWSGQRGTENFEVTRVCCIIIGNNYKYQNHQIYQYKFLFFLYNFISEKIDQGPGRSSKYYLSNNLYFKAM